jgi:hypothetical protein
MKKTAIITASIMLLTILTAKAQTYSGGVGTSDDPYQIATLSDLQYLSEHSADYAKDFIQTANINAIETNTWNVGDHDSDAETEEVAMGFSPI